MWEYLYMALGIQTKEQRGAGGKQYSTREIQVFCGERITRDTAYMDWVCSLLSVLLLCYSASVSRIRSFCIAFFVVALKITAGPRYHDLTSKPNLNWLIHMLYARQDYKQCLSIIEHQFVEAYDHEYLYFVKVSRGRASRWVMTRGRKAWS